MCTRFEWQIDDTFTFYGNWHAVLYPMQYNESNSVRFVETDENNPILSKFKTRNRFLLLLFLLILLILTILIDILVSNYW